MKIHRLPPDEVFAALGTSREGLNAAEVAARREHFGPNELEQPPAASLTLRLLRQFTHFLAVLLWAAALLSFILAYLNPDSGMGTLGWAILAVICINAFFSFFQEYRAEKAMEALRQLLPVKVRLIRGGQQEEVPAADLVVGDVIRLAEGDQVPADARLVEGVRLQVNQAALTGESDPSSRLAAASEAPALQDSRNLVWAGTTVVSGSGLAVVFATGRATEFGKVAHLTGSVRSESSPLQREIAQASRVIAAIALTLGIVFFLLNQWLGRPFWDSMIFAVGILVAGVPEGLLPTVSLALAMGSQRLAKRQALVRSLTKVETLGSATVICTDKTGTLTQNRMRVTRCWLAGDDWNLDPASFPDTSPAPWQPFLLTAALCNNASLPAGDPEAPGQGDPTEIALLHFFHQAGRDDLTPWPRVAEVPFAAERKRMSTVHRSPAGDLEIYLKGAPEVVLPLCTAWLVDAAPQPLTPAARQHLEDQAEAYAAQALRVLALAYRPLGKPAEATRDWETEERDLIFLGLVGLMDPPRPEVPAAVARCRQAGIRLIMITGDKAATAQAVGRQVGLLQDDATPVREGEALDRLSPPALRELLASPTLILARMTPKHKMRVVLTLKEMQEIVAVTGDGVNDAPALKAADIGIAMGKSGTEVARAAADLILLDDNFATIVGAIEEGRAIYANIKKFITYIFASNIPEIVPFLCYVLFNLPLPLTIIQILAVDLGTDMLPALALATEPPEPGVMQQPPRSPRQHLLTWPLLARAYLFLGPLEALAAMGGYFFVYWQAGWQPGLPLIGTGLLYLRATTMCLAGIVVCQFGNLFACRTERATALGLGLRRNPLFLYALLGNLPILAALFYFPPVQRLVGTVPLSATDWLVLLPFPFILFGADELRKWLLRRSPA